MTAADYIRESLDEEQAELLALPFMRPREEMFDDFYGGKLVLARCHYSGKPPAEPRTPRDKVSCQYCYLPASDKTVKDGVFIEHARALNDHDQGERLIGILCTVLGFDEWSDAGVYSRAAMRDESSRRLGFDGRLSRGVSYLAEQLVRRDATCGAQESLTDLVEFTRERDEHPFFTEATLYELVGKDAARSILGRVNTLKTVMGAS